MPLPLLKWKPTPNGEARQGPVTLIVLHDCQGSYQGSIATFLSTTPGKRVSAHFVIKEDGSEATQMVSLDRAAWHCRAFNQCSIGIEMAGFAERGFPASEWDAAAEITAYLLHRYNLPCVWSHRGDGKGFTSHYDLGKPGGGHSDPTTDLKVWLGFVDRVIAAYARRSFPATYAKGEPVAVDRIPKLNQGVRLGIYDPQEQQEKSKMKISQDVVAAAARHAGQFIAGGVTVGAGVVAIGANLGKLNADQASSLGLSIKALGDGLTTVTGAVAAIAGLAIAWWSAYSATHQSQANKLAAKGDTVITKPEIADASPSVNVVSASDVSVVNKP